LFLVHFAVPFLILLSRRAKRTPSIMIAVALSLLFMRLVDLFWIVAPDQIRKGLHVHWLDLAAPSALTALWTGIFIWPLRRRSLVPDDDPRLEEALSHA